MKRRGGNLQEALPISIRGEAVGSYNWASGSHKGVGSTSTIWLQPRYIGPFGSHLQPYLKSSCGLKNEIPMFGTYINKVSKSCTSQNWCVYCSKTHTRKKWKLLLSPLSGVHVVEIHSTEEPLGQPLLQRIPHKHNPLADHTCLCE